MKTYSFGQKLLFHLPGLLLLFLEPKIAFGYLILLNLYFGYLQYFATPETQEEGSESA